MDFKSRKLFLSFLVLLFVGFPFFSIAQIEDIQVGTSVRKMLVYAPSDIKENSPLLLSLHGMNQDIAYQQNQTKWELVAKEHGFVVVYPGGINNSWSLSGTRDTDFILAIIDEMASRYNIDRDRVYLSGFSMGGMMTYYAATRIADKIAAFAPVSGYLMQGPNTNSSRPIPIIHVHGTTDDVVGFSGVQRCMDAWIARNNCPTTAVVTQPYPVGKNSSNGTKYYWGPGTDSVEIVLLSLRGVGHWHSLDANGVHTSQEIWNFCKKFSLGYGVPKFDVAMVNDADPKQIMVNFSLPIKEADNYEGFTVKVDGQVVEIDNIVLANSTYLAINLTEGILNSNEVLLTYGNGNVLSTYEKDLVEFSDEIVENLLQGAPPRIIEFAVTENGDTLIAKFNKNMILPDDIASLTLKATFDDVFDVSLGEVSFYNNDSTQLVFPLGEQVFADYELLLTYSGDNIVSADGGLVKNFTDLKVTNKSNGLSVQIVSGTLENSAIAIVLGFSKAMALSDAQLPQLTIEVNGKKATVKEHFVLGKTIRFVMSTNLYHGDSIKVSYNPGNLTAADNGVLEAFSSFEVENPLNEPTWKQIPGKIEAEDFALQFGTDTEVTGDAGGGLNVGWTDTGDWLVYAIENNTEITDFEITFRIASETAGSRFEYRINDERIGSLNVPNTGGWQRWQSVVREISIPQGKHYLKFLVTSGGFNINFFELQEKTVGVNQQLIQKVKIYPNPVSNKIVINASDFKFDKIEIFDAQGKMVVNKTLNYAPELEIPISLPDGVYSVRLSNGNDFYLSRIVIQDK
jgi:poly(3-hydroxybutyrate) depolymerase